MSSGKRKNHIVKIKYDYDMIPREEIGGFMIAAFSVFFIIVTIKEKLSIGSPYSRYYDVIAAYYIPIAVTIAFIALIWSLSTSLRSLIDRWKSKKYRKTVVANGKKVIGEIVSFKEIKINSRDKKNFSYTIEYEDPLEGKATTEITPPTVNRLMFLKEEDLPIKVVIYVYKHTSFVYALINPPVVKMFARKNSEGISAIILFIGMLCAVILTFIRPSYYTFTVTAIIVLSAIIFYRVASK